MDNTDGVVGMVDSSVPLAIQEDNMKLRKLLWFHHGHSESLYGDDGEIQCNHPDCVLDFKRDSVELIVKRFDDAQFRKVVQKGLQDAEGVGLDRVAEEVGLKRREKA